ncbi:DUF881 domain-containing protein [Nocardioides sp.]|uniref:DUF881 domain-containing protein n=1 Tax=Nocardioides sp. TaxID=35761 RepID=UPI0031FE930D|nr:hypothetical protein [Nocardioides sp.]
MPDDPELSKDDESAETLDTGEPSSRQPPASGRQRLIAALFRPSRAQAVVAVLLALVAFATITQVRTNRVDDTYSGYREQDLIDVLTGLAGTTQRARAEITRLERTRDNLQSDTNAHSAALAQAQTEADTLSILAGLVPVTGPGIRVTVTETDTAIGVNSMIDTIQELRTAGAEAIQFNGQVRLIAQSAIEDGVGGIVIDGQQLSAPYVIDVIGEPSTLAGAITFPGGPRQQFEEVDANVEIQELKSLDIESIREAVQPDFAQPDGSQ